ncbi:MAG TPA: NAD-dependent epimerase/dehydratase family protein [Acidimicrobiales bacterium]|nr:NAD-dependent epimerase/dehydratase family protein [Acidimicrobiales bacterium]
MNQQRQQRVFVAGATGVLGRRAVPRLVAAGFEVTGLARSDEKAEQLRSQGASPVIVDLFDAAAVKEAVAGHDLVCNLATHIPTAARGVLPGGAWKENDRIRTEGAANLADAAIAAGAARFVQESITFVYPDRGDAWITEDEVVEETPYTASVKAAQASAERVTAAGAAGVVLRFGIFYSADSHSTRDMARAVARGLLALPGAPDAFASFISVDDAASAVVAALDPSVPAGVYNVVDDEPLTRTDLAAALSSALGRRVRTLPTPLTAAGGQKVAALARSQRVSNARFKAVAAWTPAVSARVGIPAVIEEVRGGRR